METAVSAPDVGGSAPVAAPEGATLEADATDSFSGEDADLDAAVKGDDTPEQKAEKKAQARKWKLKINGAEEEVDEPELIKRAQISSAAQEKFQKAAERERKAMEMEKLFQSAMEEMTADPRNFFKKVKVDEYEWAEKLLIEKLRYDTATPEQRRLMDLETENMTLKEKAELAEKMQADKNAAEEKARYDSLVDQASKKVDQDIGDAIRQAGIKATPGLIARMAEKMYAQHLHDRSSVNASVALKNVLADLKAQNLELLEALPDTELENLPKSFVEKLRKSMLAKVQQPIVSRRDDGVTRSSDTRRSKTMSTDEIFERFEKKYRG